MFHKIEFAAREEKFPESSGVREVRANDFIPDRALDDEPVRPRNKKAFYGGWKRFHVTILLEQQAFVTLPILSVIPAEAGIQSRWIPTFVGMTNMVTLWQATGYFKLKTFSIRACPGQENVSR
jgi:hypothetical protein